MEEESIDIKAYAGVLLRRWRLLLFLPILAGVVAFGFSVNRAATSGGNFEYQATTILLMDGVGSIGNYPELVKTGPILSSVIEDLGLDLSQEQLRLKISAENIGDGILKIDISDSDPTVAVVLADGIAESVIQHIGSVRESQFIASQGALSKILAELGQPDTSETVQDVVDALSSMIQRPSVIAPAEVFNDPAVTGSGAGQLPLVGAAALNVSEIPRNTVIGIVFGIGVAVVVIISLEYLQNPIRSPNQVERHFALSHLGSIPRWRRRRNGPHQLVVFDAAGPAVAEAVRQTATNIAFAANDQGIKSLAVVSSDTGDGRTSLVANMGVVLAAGWKDVVLVDADLRRPSLHRYFNLTNHRGLSSLMTDPNLEIADVMQETPYERLKVITSGPVLQNQLDVLRCPRMTWLLNRLKDAGSTVLVDTPPISTTTDAAIIGSQVQGVVVVAIDSRSTVDGLKSTLDTLQRANANLLGFVWNQAIAGPFDFWSRKQRYYRRLKHESAARPQLEFGAVPTQENAPVNEPSSSSTEAVSR